MCPFSAGCGPSVACLSLLHIATAAGFLRRPRGTLCSCRLALPGWSFSVLLLCLRDVPVLGFNDLPTASRRFACLCPRGGLMGFLSQLAPPAAHSPPVCPPRSMAVAWRLPCLSPPVPRLLRSPESTALPSTFHSSAPTSAAAPLRRRSQCFRPLLDLALLRSPAATRCQTRSVVMCSRSPDATAFDPVWQSLPICWRWFAIGLLLLRCHFVCAPAHFGQGFFGALLYIRHRWPLHWYSLLLCRL